PEPGGEERDPIPACAIGAAAATQAHDRLEEEKRSNSSSDDRDHASIVPPIGRVRAVLPAVREELARFRELLKAEVPRDDHALHLVRALADLEDLLVAVEPRDRELVHEPVAAVDLERCVHGP